MSTECPDCGETFEQIGTHWHHNGYPDISEHKESLIGMALGDGSFDNNGGHSRIRIIMTNKEFIDWYRTQLGWLGTDARVHRTAEEATSAGQGLDNPGNFKAQYVVSTRNHPEITELHYKICVDGHTSVQSSIKITWESLTYWYISDGTYEFSEKAANPRVCISVPSQTHKEQEIIDMFDNLEITPSITTGKIRLGVDETQVFFENTTPIPGFEHKWGNTMNRNV